jgi:hypothetical protein
MKTHKRIDKILLAENEMVALFDGRKKTMMDGYTWWSDHKDHDPFNWQSENLRYHSDWNWLMGVVDKIESMGDNDSTRYNVGIEINSCVITKWDDGQKDESFIVGQEDAANKIEAVFYAVIDFIARHNSLKP